MEEAPGSKPAGVQPAGAVPAPRIAILSWNLFHGRAVPPVDRSLYGEFAAMIAGWSWDVALLQEVPPWWPPRLARELGVEQRSAPTSRNSLPALRRALAERRPELLKSNGGGCNAILSRWPIVEHATLRLRRWPERRVAQLARLIDGTRVVNVHASTRRRRAAQELERLSREALLWAGAERLILGGDLNLRRPPAAAPALESSEASARGGALRHVAGSGVDHLFARGLLLAGATGLGPAATAAADAPAASNLPGAPRRDVLLDGRRVELSDHEPLLVSLRAEAAG